MSIKFYKITSDKGNKVYIGSTKSKYLAKRWSDHKFDYKQQNIGLKRRCASCDLFDEYGVENCKIEIIEENEFKSDEERFKREREIYDEYKQNINIILVNVNRPSSTIEEQKESKRQSYLRLKEERPDELLERRQKDNEKSKEKVQCEICQLEMSKGSLTRHKKRLH
jgi:ribosomal protein L44E